MAIKTAGENWKKYSSHTFCNSSVSIPQITPSRNQINPILMLNNQYWAHDLNTVYNTYTECR